MRKVDSHDWQFYMTEETFQLSKFFSYFCYHFEFGGLFARQNKTENLKTNSKVSYWGKFSNQVFLWFQWRFVRTWTFVIFIPGWASMRAAKKRSPEAPLPLLNVFTPILLQEILLQVFQLKIHASRIPKEDQRTWQLRQQFRNSRFRIGFRNFHQRPLRQHWPASTQKWSSLWLRQNRWNQNHDRYLKNKFLF